MNTPGAGGGRRETRLLLATIAVSVGMLLVLARFRFPEEVGRQTVEPAAAPLERLAARATYEELAGVMADLERRVIPVIVPLGSQGEDGVRYVPAVRVTPDRAVALLPRDRRLVAVGPNATPRIVLREADTELIVVQTAAQPEAVAALPPAAGRPGPRYVAVAEVSGGAAAIRPVYIGRTDRFLDARWPDPLMSVAAVQQTLSFASALFSLDGTFVGLATEAGGRVAVVPSFTLRSAAAGTLAAPAARGVLPIEVQPLTASLARTAGAEKGVMVTYVSPGASDAAGVMSGDVIQSIDNTEVASVAGFQQLAESRAPGATVTLGVVRRGKAFSTKVTAAVADSVPETGGDNLGAILRSISGVGSEVVTVERGSPAERAGLHRGDLIVALDGVEEPTPAATVRAFRTATPGQGLLVTVRRGGDHRVLALERQ